MYSTKKGRATNFSTEEDMLLVSAWRNISMDPIQGSNQTHQTYWERIAAFYNESKTFSSDRTANSLSHRWSVINSLVSKFVGYYNQVQEKNQNGLSEQDKVQSRFIGTPCASAQSQFIGTPVPENEERMERPMGNKTAKRLKIVEHDVKWVEFIATLTHVKDMVSKLSEARHEKIQQMIDLEKERFKAAEEREKAMEERERAKEERENRMYEMSILGIDTSTIEAPLAEYYKSLKAGILKKMI